jgi:hypothetical protein
MTDLIVSTGRGLEVWEETNTVFTNLQDGLSPEERKAQVRKTMAAAIGIDDRLNLVAGELLYEVAQNEYWKDWEFESFADYCEAELNMRDRKAKYLISIYDKFVIKLNLPKEILLDLQWSKAKELVSVITEDNWVGLIDGLNTMTVKDVKFMVKEMKGVPRIKDGSDSEDITERVVFNLSKEQAENISTALGLAGTMVGSDKTGNQLDLICSDFLASSAGEGLSGAIDKLDFHIKSLSRTFGVEIKVETVDSERYSELLGSEETETKEVESDEVSVS